MRKSLLYLSIVAVLAVSCAVREDTGAPDPSEARTILFVAQTQPDATRTAFGPGEDGVYPTRWTPRDTAVAVSLNHAAKEEARVSAGPDFSYAQFEYTTAVQAESYIFHLLTPSSAAEKMNGTRAAWQVCIPTVQTPSKDSPDEAAQILAATTGTLQEVPARLGVHFSHVTSYGRLTLLNLPGEAVVRSVTLSCSTPLAGKWYLSAGESGATPVLEPLGASSTLVIRTSETEGVWFACAPGDVSGSTLKVIVSTDLGTFEKSVTLRSGRSFKPGRIASFSIDFRGISPIPGHPYEDDPLFSLDTYGAYRASGNRVYAAGADQLSREYAADGKTLCFSIVSPATGKILELDGIPVSPLLGDSFTLQCREIQGLSSQESSHSVTVLRMDDGKVWLKDSRGNGFIIKL